MQVMLGMSLRARWDATLVRSMAETLVEKTNKKMLENAWNNLGQLKSRLPYTDNHWYYLHS